MARPKQDGLLYFSFDTDFFYSDKRIRRLISKFGNDGLMIYIYLLTESYRTKGYYTSWDDETAEDMADILHLKEGFIEQVLTYLRGRSLLTMSTLSTGVTIITSPGIQKRYQEAVKGRKRQIEVDDEIWLLSEEDTASCIKFTYNDSFSEKNQSKSEKNQSKSEKNSIKESKVNKSKAKQRECITQIEEFMATYPKECNRHLTEIAYCNLIMDGVETEDNLVMCAKNYAETCKIEGTPERYIKNAENFLQEFVFERYLPGKYEKPKSQVVKPKTKFHNFEGHHYDIEELERQLINR